MTRRERVIAALRHTTTDILPHHVDFTAESLRRCAEAFGDDSFVSRIDNHLYQTGWNGNLRPLAGRPGEFIDDWGVIWDRRGADKDIGIIREFPLPEATMADFRPPMIDDTAIRATCREALASAEDKFTIFGIGFSLFERAWTLRSMPELLMDMVSAPEFVSELLDAIVEINLRVLAIACEFPFDAIYFGDDWGQQNGLIMGPHCFREFLLPRLTKMYAFVHAHDKFVLQHSCGDLREVMDDIVDAGLDCYNTFQPEIYDIKAFKARYKGRLSIWGGVSTQHVLPHGTPDDVRAEALELMRVMGEGGGYIAAPTHAMPYDVPPENVAALLDVFLGQVPGATWRKPLCRS